MTETRMVPTRSLDPGLRESHPQSRDFSRAIRHGVSVTSHLYAWSRVHMTTPRRGLLFHFTHISNLASIAQDGLCCDSDVTSSGRPFTEVGNQEIKERRRSRRVPIPPGGSVADFVPFYFAARSPMLYSIHMGNVETYTGGQDEVVYLTTSIDELAQYQLPFVFTDRNAALDFAQFGDDPADLDHYVDWDLMEAQMWRNSPSDPDRRERRMAELLVHHVVPWSAISMVATRNKSASRQAANELTTVGADTPVNAKPEWYF